jgi:hypothetical protein
LVDVQPRLLRIGFPQERPNPGDDLARPIPVADDAPGGFASLIEVGRGAADGRYASQGDRNENLPKLSTTIP